MNNLVVPTKIAVVVLASNSYSVLGIRLLAKWMRHYRGLADVSLYFFGDVDPRPYLPDLPGYNIQFRMTKHYSWEAATNSKFISILSIAKDNFDYLIYIDADTDIYKPFTEEWFMCDGMMGLQHYGDITYMQDKPELKTLERNPISKAYIPLDSLHKQTYYAGAFFGGVKEEILSFCETLRINQRCDKLKKFEACLNDESHINWFFHYNVPTKVVPAVEFPFDISNKGGFSNIRVYIDQRPLLKKIQANKDSHWTLINKQLSIIS